MLKLATEKYKAAKTWTEQNYPNCHIVWAAAEWLLQTCVAPAIVGIWVTGIYTKWEWGVFSKITLILAVILVLTLSFYRDFKIAGRRAFYSSWISLVLLLSFIIRVYYLEPKSKETAANGASSTTDVQNSPAPTVSSASMNQPGESGKLHAGQTLQAPFAAMTLHIYSVATDRPGAEITVSASGQSSQQLDRSPGSPIYTNWIDGKCYIASVGAVGCADTPPWVTIKIEEEGHNIIPQQPEQTQWYFQIDGVAIVPQSPNGPTTPIRVVAEVNGQQYGYPSLSDYVIGGSDIKESWPLAIGSKQYTVRFVGFLKRIKKKEFPALAGIQAATLNVAELPETNKIYKTFVLDPETPSGPQTEVDVNYSIIKLD